MGHLYKNEIRKLVAKKSSWILMIIALVFEALVMIVQHATDKSLTTGKLVMGGGPQIGGTFVLIFSIVVTAIIVTEEFQRNTVKLLLTRPYTRSQVLGSKFLAAFSYMLSSYVAVYVFGILLSLILGGGFNDITETVSAVNATPLMYAILGLESQLFVNIFYLLVTFLLAAGMRSQALSITFSIGLYFLLQNIGTMFSLYIAFTKMYWLKWNPMTLIMVSQDSILNIGLTKIASFSGLNTPLWAAMLALLAYMIVIYYFADLIFKKRDISLS